MSFVVDTDICSAYIKAHPLVWDRVVTHNTADYANIPGLRFVDWMVP